MVKFDGSLLLAGGGQMGMGLLKGWLAGGLDKAALIVLEPRPSPELQKLNVRLNPPVEDIAKAAPLASVLAVKPQIAAEVLPSLADHLPRDGLVLSILAGTRLATLENLAGGRAVIRTMPNTPASIGHGMSVLCAGANVSSAQREIGETLMQAVGKTVWLDDESLMDAATAISGSGPAYVFHLVESMSAAGVTLGLAEEVAANLARATVAGAGAMLDHLPQSAETLRENVTSPNGTTAAALDILAAPEGLRALMNKAAKAAAQRSAELATESEKSD